ncbi:hypothetical protein DSECCO2_530680 [anaerobic digester metagenome]
MAEILKRWDEPTQQWVAVTNVNRIEVSGGGGLMSCSASFSVGFLDFEFTYFQSVVTTTDI